MTRRTYLILLILGWLGLSGDWARAASGAGEIYRIQLNGVIDPITAEFIVRSIDAANEAHAELILIQLQTPGGLNLSMNQITGKILNSSVPIVVYVAPGGARAASAGFFILLSADIAVMAPATNTGAAHPVLSVGGFPVAGDPMLDKVTNDAAASLRGIAKNRGRNADLAEQGVRNSRSFTEREALDGGLIDLVAKDEGELLARLDGRKVTLFRGQEVLLHTKGLGIRDVAMSRRQRFWSALSNPSLSALLLIGGILLLMVEFSHPGFIVPGVAGGICLILSFLGMQVLPLNYVGLLLMLLAFGLFIAEFKVGGFGVLGFGGIVSLFLGLLLLVDVSRSEVGGISVRDALVIVIPFAILFMLLLRLVLSTARARVMTGSQGMIGCVGTAQSPIALSGKVFVRGELWNAVSAKPIAQGHTVRVIKMENLQLIVEEVQDPTVE